MAKLLPEEMRTKPGPFVGHQLLNIITAGMYDDPLMVYREYVQNAVDSIDIAIQKGIFSKKQAVITIQVDGNDRTICIEDNGAGLPNDSAPNVLLNLGFSPKNGVGQRGFRGIGRLGGLAYCDLVRFTTRSSANEDVTVVEWDRKQLDAMWKKSGERKSLVEVVKNITKVYRKKAAQNDKDHFFRVEMHGVRRFHSDKLMGIKVVRNYLSQVSPVPYDRLSFSHTEKIDVHFSNVPAYMDYRLTVNGKTVLRPYADKMQVSTNIEDTITDVKLFEFPGSSSPLAKGWYAIMNHKGSLPLSVAMRGIRVRQGNIQVGDEYFLSPFYLERRFATWTIGEIQICDHNIRPNARRDGFEHTPEYESFLEHATALGRHLSQLCRKSSSERSYSVGLTKRLEEIELTLAPLVFFVDEEHRQNVLAAIRGKLEGVKLFLDSSGDGKVMKERYTEIQSKINLLSEGDSFFHERVDQRSIATTDGVAIIGKILKTLCYEYKECKTAEDLMQRVIKPFLKST